MFHFLYFIKTSYIYKHAILTYITFQFHFLPHRRVSSVSVRPFRLKYVTLLRDRRGTHERFPSHAASPHSVLLCLFL